MSQSKELVAASATPMVLSVLSRGESYGSSSHALHRVHGHSLYHVVSNHVLVDGPRQKAASVLATQCRYRQRSSPAAASVRSAAAA
jgi:hypothetical protein